MAGPRHGCRVGRDTRMQGPESLVLYRSLPSSEEKLGCCHIQSREVFGLKTKTLLLVLCTQLERYLLKLSNRTCTVKEYTDSGFYWAEGLKFLFPAFGRLSCGISWVESKSCFSGSRQQYQTLRHSRKIRSLRPFTDTVNLSSVWMTRSRQEKK